ncbi:verprolin-like X8 [Biomphalaria pfeifferi]|uniref:Verprolin-like X8 n=1 Tax=Biomphalaria pfeifferi TaxID=112525 RepID=A0AAD8BYG4_BIOPF|nr:verprolin-like X8 [Biomphalaria pfeifferi]
MTSCAGFAGFCFIKSRNQNKCLTKHVCASIWLPTSGSACIRLAIQFPHPAPSSHTYSLQINERMERQRASNCKSLVIKLWTWIGRASSSKGGPTKSSRTESGPASQAELKVAPQVKQN